MDAQQIAWQQVQKRQVFAMRLSCKIVGNLLERVSAEDARRLRDGPDGWSIVEIVCHLRDFDEIFRARAQMMRAQDKPQLPAYDHEAMARDRGYQAQDLRAAFQSLQESRQRTVDFFKSLSPQEWQRDGVHPERDSFTMVDAAMQVPLHDLDHIEQMTRVLAQA